MSLDIILTIITLIVAVIGTLLKDPSRRVKVFLISLAALASLASVIKAVADASDKEFMKTAIISTLTPSNFAFQKLVNDIHDEDNQAGFDTEICHHDADGMTCFLSSSTDKNKHGTLVFNRMDIAEMYANDIQRTSNKKLIDAAFAQSYDPKELKEEFSDKVGLLGTAVFFNMYGRWPDYTYDDSFGVKIIFEKDGVTKEVLISPVELASFQKQRAPDLFYALEKEFRDKYKQQSP
jgi:hypothetical protein